MKTKTPGKKAKQMLFQKEKSPLKKRKLSSSDDEDDTYKPSTLFQEAQRMKESQASVEDESEPDVDIHQPKMKKSKTVQLQIQEDNYEEEKNEDDKMLNTDESYASMVANLARAHSLVQSTGKISQSICLKDDDGFINIMSPGERGSMLMK